MRVKFFPIKGERTSGSIVDLLSFIDAFASFSSAGEAERESRKAGESRGSPPAAGKGGGKVVHGAA